MIGKNDAERKDGILKRSRVEEGGKKQTEDVCGGVAEWG